MLLFLKEKMEAGRQLDTCPGCQRQEEVTRGAPELESKGHGRERGRPRAQLYPGVHAPRGQGRSTPSPGTPASPGHSG